MTPYGLMPCFGFGSSFFTTFLGAGFLASADTLYEALTLTKMPFFSPFFKAIFKATVFVKPWAARYFVIAGKDDPVRSFKAMMAALQRSPYLGPSGFAEAGFDGGMMKRVGETEPFSVSF